MPGKSRQDYWDCRLISPDKMQDDFPGHGAVGPGPAVRPVAGGTACNVLAIPVI
jgi:hypothetical protein